MRCHEEKSESDYKHPKGDVVRLRSCRNSPIMGYSIEVSQC